MTASQAFAEDPLLSGDASAAEKRLFRKILAKPRTLPEGVHRLGFRFGEDSYGDPAVWIVLSVDDDLNPSDAKIEALQTVARAVRAEIARTGTERWPYVEIAAE